MTGNISFLSDFEETNGGYVAFEGNPKGDTECVVLSFDYKLSDENYVLLRVSRENNMYTVDLKNVVPSGEGKATKASCKSKPVSSISQPLQRVLVTKPHRKKYYELLLGRSPSIGFMRPFGYPVTILNTLDPLKKFNGKANEGFLVGYSFYACIKENLDAGKVGKETVSAQQYVLLPLWSTGLQDPQNIDDDVADSAFDVKENENDVYVSANGSNKTDNKKHDEKAKRDDKGKSPVDSPTGVRDLRAEFEEFSFNSTNRINAINPSKYPDDLDIPKLEDIIYSDDEEDVGAEANLSNLETNIPVSPITTTRVHKDPPVNQIIGDLNLDPQTRSMTRMLKEQDGCQKCFSLEPLKKRNGFQRGKIDQTLFIKKQKGDILLVQVYVDDIIFGSTNKKLCKAFEKLMKDKFQMSYMGELTFLLGLQVKQKDDVIFISQDKYVAEILKKFGFTDVKSAGTPIKTEKPLLKDHDGEDVDVHIYRSTIESLMYLTLSRPDIMFAVCACARFQVTPKMSHLHAVKRIFRYLKGKSHLGLWYPRDSPFNLMAYSDSDYAGTSLDRKSTTGGCQFLGCRLIYWQCKKQIVVAISSIEAEYVAAASCCAQVLWIQN
uniref:Uncharacterized mitochondrial protein AtMg00810-like n=1 Tax=Tanacetum cinerariifolium TaxID=118510 RepID=A0A6L2LF05_TANCI|nr:uncharacterized mitochondrial protein AtMg00810-like [Tanacetum cinerariifolium]